MKKTLLFSKLLLAMILLLESSVSQAQTCIINTSVNGISGTGTASNNIGQSFTACRSGTLSTVSCEATNTSVATVKVVIYAGEGAGGTKLGEGAIIQIGKSRTNTWDLNSLNIKVVSGQKYTAMFLTATGTPAITYSTSVQYNYYAGGQVINYGASNNDMFFGASITQLNPTLTPLHQAANVSRVSPLTLQFDRAMKVNTGNITLKNVTLNTSVTIPVQDLVINSSLVTIPYTNFLEPNTQYEITVPSTALSSTTGISFEGLAATKWTFTTSNKVVPVLASTLGAVTNQSTIPFTLNFSENVTGFDVSDLTITNGVATNFTGSGKTYSFDVTPTAGGNVNVKLLTDVTVEGNEATEISVIYDNIAPTVITKNATLFLDALGNGTLTVANVNNGSTDNVTPTGSLILALDKTAFTCADLGNNTVKLTVTDALGNVGFANATVTVKPRAVAMFSKNITVQLASNGSVTIAPADVNSGSIAYCNLNLSLSISKSTFTCAELGANTIKLYGNDNNGNLDSVTAVVTVQNKNLPTVITKNQNVTLDLATGKAIITTSMIDNGSTSVCGGLLTMSLSKTTFKCADIGSNQVMLYVTDAQGNVASANATVTVASSINDEDLTPTLTTVPLGGNTDITTNSSLVGVTYSLRNNNGNAVIGSPIAGTGNPLVFNTGALNTPQTFNVIGDVLTSSGTSALDFDGSNDIVNTTMTTPATAAFTIEFWAYPRAAVYRRLISNFTNTPIAGEFIIDTYNATNNGRGLRFVVKGTTTVSQTAGAANVLTLNTWNHIAATFDNGSMKLFVNGALIASATSTFTTVPACSNLVRFGEDAVIVTPEYFDGKLDEIRYWTTARTQGEIANNLNKCLSGTEVGLRNYFKISEGTGTTVSDLKGSTVGTMSGMDAATDWVAGNVDCMSASCIYQMSDIVTINVDNATSVNNDDLNAKLSISPNPVRSALTINSNAKILNAEVYSVVGQLLLSTQGDKIDVSDLNSGVYLIEITTENGSSQGRFVKE